MAPPARDLPDTESCQTAAPAAHLPDKLKNQNRKLNGGFLNSDGWREWRLSFPFTVGSGHEAEVDLANVISKNGHVAV